MPAINEVTAYLDEILNLKAFASDSSNNGQQNVVPEFRIGVKRQMRGIKGDAVGSKHGNALRIDSGDPFQASAPAQAVMEHLICCDQIEKIIIASFLFDMFSGDHGQLADSLMQLLTVAACFHRCIKSGNHLFCTVV